MQCSHFLTVEQQMVNKWWIFFFQQHMAQSLKSKRSWHNPWRLIVAGRTSGIYSSRAAVATLQSSQTALCGDTGPPDVKVFKCMKVKHKWIGFKQLIATITCLWQHMNMGLHVETHLWKWISSSCCSSAIQPHILCLILVSTRNTFSFFFIPSFVTSSI